MIKENANQRRTIEQRRRDRVTDTTSMGSRRQNRSMGAKSMSNLKLEANDKQVELRAQNVQRGHSSLNQSFQGGRDRGLNQTMMTNNSKLDGSIMLEKKQNVKASQQNMEQLRHRIDALKRNVELAQKKEA